MIGSYKLLETDTQLLIPNGFEKNIYLDDRDHLEMYPNIFEKDINLELFDYDSIYSIPEETQLKKIDISHTGLPIKIIENLIMASKNIEDITIKTNESGYINLFLIAIKMDKIKKIKIYDNTMMENFYIIMEMIIKLSDKISDIKIYVSDISGGNGHLYQTHITIISDIEIQFVLQYIITPNNLQNIFNKCINLSILNISEDFNADFPTYSYIFGQNIIFPKKLTTLILLSDTEKEIIEIANSEILTLDNIIYL